MLTCVLLASVVTWSRNLPPPALLWPVCNAQAFFMAILYENVAALPGSYVLVVSRFASGEPI